MDEKLFQNVLDKIQDYLPADWRKMVFFAGYTEGSYSMKFYSKAQRGSFTDCFSLPGIKRTKLIKTFMDIDKILARERAGLEGESRWTVFTMMVDSDGNMKTEFDYNDHSDDMVMYEKEWEQKYLIN